MKNILIFSNGEKIGDGLIKLPFIHEVRRRFVKSKIHWMTNKGTTVYNSRLKHIASQYIDVIYESVNLSPFFWNKISNKYNFENLKFDCIIDTQKAVLRTIALKRIGNKMFISNSASGFFSSKKLRNKEKFRRYYLEDLFDLLDLIKPGENKDYFKFDIPLKLKNCLSNLFEKNKKYIGYAPGAGEKNKIWNISNYIKVIKYFENKNFKSVFFLGPDDIELKKKIKQEFPNGFFPEDLITDFSGPEVVMGCTQYLNVALSNDSGVSHMLSTNYCSLIKLFGPKNSLKFTPNISKIKTLSSEKYNSDDINLIPVFEVINLIEKEL